MKIEIKLENSGRRVDVFLSEHLDESRNLIIKHIKSGNINVNDSKVKAGYILKENDFINVGELKETTEIKGENIPLDICYEDEYLMVINKPSGMVVHPAPGSKDKTLVNALIHHTNSLSDVNTKERPGIVHRIDKNTSGLLLVAKTNKVHNILADGFKNKTIKRKYIALVHGVIPTNKGKIDAPIGRHTTDRKKLMVTDINGKKSVTYFDVIERFNKATLIELTLETGRTHQIRVHLEYINHPVVNDPVYGKYKTINNYGQMLHAGYLAFNHPITKEALEFNAPLEEEFNEILKTFN